MEFVDDGKTVKVGEHSFAKLSPRDRQQLLAPVKAARRVLLKVNLAEGGIAGAEYVNELDAFDQSVWGDTEFFDFLQSLDGRVEILSLAATKADPAKAVGALDGLTLTLDEDFRLAAKLVGITLVKKEAAEASPTHEEGEEKRPSVAGS